MHALLTHSVKTIYQPVLLMLDVCLGKKGRIKQGTKILIH